MQAHFNEFKLETEGINVEGCLAVVLSSYFSCCLQRKLVAEKISLRRKFLVGGNF